MSKASFSYDFINLIICIYTVLQILWKWQHQFRSVAQLCVTLCDPIDSSTPGLPVHHQFPEVLQTHVHWVGAAIQPSHPLPSPSPPAFKLAQNWYFPMSQFFTLDGQSIGVSAFWMLSCKSTFSLSSFTFLKRLFSSLMSAIMVVSSAYLRLSIFLLAILIPACASFTWHFAWYALHIS